MKLDISSTYRVGNIISIVRVYCRDLCKYVDLVELCIICKISLSIVGTEML